MYLELNSPRSVLSHDKMFCINSSYNLKNYLFSTKCQVKPTLRESLSIWLAKALLIEMYMYIYSSCHVKYAYVYVYTVDSRYLEFQGIH